MTDVTEDRDHGEPGLSAADEQLLRELSERARTGGLKLTGGGGLVGKLTKMGIEGALEGELELLHPERAPALRSRPRAAQAVTQGPRGSGRGAPTGSAGGMAAGG